MDKPQVSSNTRTGALEESLNYNNNQWWPLLLASRSHPVASDPSILS